MGRELEFAQKGFDIDDMRICGSDGFDQSPCCLCGRLSLLRVECRKRKQALDGLGLVRQVCVMDRLAQAVDSGIQNVVPSAIQDAEWQRRRLAFEPCWHGQALRVQEHGIEQT